jgi:DNA polymerase I-like protein with 3'-5' exonuclease and polymerase domains
MKRWIFDLETNGLLDTVSRVHCLWLKDPDTGEERSYADASDEYDGTIADGLSVLGDADEIAGHNVLSFDLPALKMVLGWEPGEHVHVVDTLNDSRLIWADLSNIDFVRSRQRKDYPVPPKLYGSHSLKAWGYRMGILKGTFGETTDWADWSREMHDYCGQDVRVNVELLLLIEKKGYSQRARDLEYDFQRIIFDMEQNGWCFNQAAGEKLYAELQGEYRVLHQKLAATWPARVEKLKAPAYWLAPDGEKFYKKGDAPAAIRRDLAPGPPKTKSTPFNPGSRTQVLAALRRRGLKITTLTEEDIESLDISEAEDLKQYYRLKKLIGQLANGKQSWLKASRGGRIHGRVNTNGAVTGRCTHSAPNVAQVPKVMIDKATHSPRLGAAGKWGYECRSLFRASEGLTMVGADASGIELRCLAHYLARYDGGAYGDIILNGDIHTVNQHAAGLPTRDQAKTFIYALLYGAGDVKIGSIVEPLSPPERQKIVGRKLRAKFFTKLPAFGQLSAAVKKAAETGFLTGLDGRKLRVRSTHAALNTLLQSAGALIMKQAGVFADRTAKEAGIEFRLVGQIHDEYQYEVRPDQAEALGKIIVRSLREAGESFNFRIPIDGEYKIGPTWAETH